MTSIQCRQGLTCGVVSLPSARLADFGRFVDQEAERASVCPRVEG